MEWSNQDMDETSEWEYQKYGKRADDMRLDYQGHGDHRLGLRTELDKRP